MEDIGKVGQRCIVKSVANASKEPDGRWLLTFKVPVLSVVHCLGLLPYLCAHETRVACGLLVALAGKYGYGFRTILWGMLRKL